MTLATSISEARALLEGTNAKLALQALKKFQPAAADELAITVRSAMQKMSGPAPAAPVKKGKRGAAAPAAPPVEKQAPDALVRDTLHAADMGSLGFLDIQVDGWAKNALATAFDRGIRTSSGVGWDGFSHFEADLSESGLVVEATLVHEAVEGDSEPDLYDGKLRDTLRALGAMDADVRYSVEHRRDGYDGDGRYVVYTLRATFPLVPSEVLVAVLGKSKLLALASDTLGEDTQWDRAVARLAYGS